MEESDDNSIESHDEQATQQRSRLRIIVPQRVIGGGLDSKFESDPYDINLHKLLTARDYTASINRINELIKPARSKSIDTILLYSGALMLPLVVWGVRHRMLMKKRKKLLLLAIDEFNDRHPQLYMRWNRRPLSILTIERTYFRFVGENITMETALYRKK